MGKAVNPDKIIPEPCKSHSDILNSNEALKLVESLESVTLAAQNHYNDFNLHHVVNVVMQTLFAANKMIDYHKPWALAKETDNLEAQQKLKAVLALGLESARVGSLILMPIIPRLTCHLLDFLNVPYNSRTWNNSKYLNTGRNDTIMPKQQDFSFFQKIR